MLLYHNYGNGYEDYRLQQYGQHHRPNGPAMLYNNGDWSWYLFGNWHRYYGPAWIDAADDGELWFFHGNRIRR